MTYLIITALTLIAALALIFARGLMNDLRVGLNKDREHRAHERELHGEQVARLIHDFGEERRAVSATFRDRAHAFDAERERWEKEREVLLNRIQDPASTAFASTVALIPPSEDMSMEVTR